MEFASLTFIISFVIVSISPAICEEAVFRGVVMHSFDNGKNKWIAIVVTGLIFGAFHGNIWRFVPAALLGIMLGYIVYETDNMIYGALFHAINNAMPLLSIFAMKSMYSNEMFQSQMSTMTDNGIPLIDRLPLTVPKEPPDFYRIFQSLFRILPHLFDVPKEHRSQQD